MKDFLIELNLASKNDAVQNEAEKVKETNDETHLAQEATSENVPESGQQDINGEQSNETHSSPLHESPIRLGSQIGNEANYISNESYAIIESQYIN